MLVSIGIGGCGVNVCLSYRKFRYHEKNSNDCPCILVDTDPKGIPASIRFPEPDKQQAKQQAKQQKPAVVIEEYCQCKTWAHAFDVGKKRIVCRVLDTIPNLTSKHVPGFLVFFSLLGSTGGGVGSALIEALRATFPSCYIACAIVDTNNAAPVGRLNRAISMLWANHYSDAMFYLSNCLAHRQITSKLEAARSVTLKDLNRFFAGLICGAFRAQLHDPPGLPTFAELVSSTCPIPEFKMLILFQGNSLVWNKDGVLPQRLDTVQVWGKAIGDASLHFTRWLRQLNGQRNCVAVQENLCNDLANTSQQIGVETCMSLLISCAGELPIPSDIQGEQYLRNKLNQAVRVVEWNTSASFLAPHVNRNIVTQEKSVATNDKLLENEVEVTVICNSLTSAIQILQNVNESAKCLWEAGAYIHWFQAATDVDVKFESVFHQLDKLIANYLEMI